MCLLQLVNKYDISLFRLQVGARAVFCSLVRHQLNCSKPCFSSQEDLHGQHTSCKHRPPLLVTAGKKCDLEPPVPKAMFHGPAEQRQLHAACLLPTGAKLLQETTDVASPCHAASPRQSFKLLCSGRRPPT